MKLLFLRCGLIYPQLAAGLELTAHHLAQRLALDGFRTLILGRTLASRYFPGESSHSIHGVGSMEVMTKAFHAFQPDAIVVLQAGHWLSHFLPGIAAKPTIIYEHDINLSLPAAPHVLLEQSHFLANSQTCASYIQRSTGKSSIIIPPLFGVEKYQGIWGTGQSILLVSPSRGKGGDIAVEIAAAK